MGSLAREHSLQLLYGAVLCKQLLNRIQYVKELEDSIDVWVWVWGVSHAVHMSMCVSMVCV